MEHVCENLTAHASIDDPLSQRLDHPIFLRPGSPGPIRRPRTLCQDPSTFTLAAHESRGRSVVQRTLDRLHVRNTPPSLDYFPWKPRMSPRRHARLGCSGRTRPPQYPSDHPDGRSVVAVRVSRLHSPHDSPESADSAIRQSIPDDE